MTEEEKLPELTSDVYMNWLVAGRPPFTWFIKQPSLVQEALAKLGEEYLERCAALSVASQEDDADALQNLAARAIRSSLEKDKTPAPVPSKVMTPHKGGNSPDVAATPKAPGTILGREPDKADS
jgi:hypothetical protein